MRGRRLLERGRFGRRFVITVCKDGHVSIIDTNDNARQRRLGSALPVFTVNEITTAMELIRRLCVLSRCHHGSVMGTLVEPRMLSWPLEASLEDLEGAGVLFEEEYKKLLRMGVDQNVQTARKPAAAAKRRTLT